MGQQDNTPKTQHGKLQELSHSFPSFIYGTPLSSPVAGRPTTWAKPIQACPCASYMPKTAGQLQQRPPTNKIKIRPLKQKSRRTLAAA